MYSQFLLQAAAAKDIELDLETLRLNVAIVELLGVTEEELADESYLTDEVREKLRQLRFERDLADHLRLELMQRVGVIEQNIGESAVPKA